MAGGGGVRRGRRPKSSGRGAWASGLIAFALGAGLGCTKTRVPEGELRIGQFGSFTGSEATFGQSTDRGIRLMIDARNAAGGVRGKKIVLISEDNQGKAEDTIAIVKKLIAQDQVVALLGEVASTRSLAAAPIAQQYKIPMITPSSTNPAVTAKRDYVFRVCFIDPVQGPIMARFVAEDLKFKRVAILRDIKSDYSLGLAKFFAAKFQELGGQVVASLDYSSNDPDFKAQLTQIRALDAQGIFVPGYYSDLGPIARQARELGLKIPLMGGDGWDSPKLFELAAGAMEGSYFTNHYSAESTNPATQKFVRDYRAKYGVSSDGLAAAGYDAAGILLAAIERAPDLTPKSIRAELARTTDYPGATGTISINADRNADKDVFVVKIVGDTYKFVKMFRK